MKKQNLAARAGRWSAQHRKKAVFGWFAFVIVATLIGGSHRHQDDRLRRGGARRRLRRAHEIVKDTFPQAAGEQVFIQSKTQGSQSAGYRAAVKDVEHRLAAVENVSNIQSPYAKQNAGQISRDGRSVARDVRDQGRLDAGRGQGRPGPRRHRRGPEGPS